MPNGQGSVGPSPVPGWLGQVASVTAQLGVPTVVAGVLLWFILFRVDNSMKYIQAQEDARTEVVRMMQKDLIETLQRQTTAFEAAIDKNVDAVNRNVAANERQTQLLERLTAPR